jgi:hypothetical protein
VNAREQSLSVDPSAEHPELLGSVSEPVAARVGCEPAVDMFTRSCRGANSVTFPQRRAAVARG